jgi:hypothetical protein
MEAMDLKKLGDSEDSPDGHKRPLMHWSFLAAGKQVDVMIAAWTQQRLQQQQRRPHVAEVGVVGGAPVAREGLRPQLHLETANLLILNYFQNFFVNCFFFFYQLLSFILLYNRFSVFFFSFYCR